MNIPDPEGIKAILNTPGAPPRLLLDLDQSDGDDLKGLVYVSLDKDGNLVEVDA